MRVAPYTPEHKEEMHAICLATASERARIDPVHQQFTLAMYCDPYLEHGLAFMLLDDDGVARGYTLGCEDYATWPEVFAPYAAKIRSLSAEHAERMEGEMAAFAAVADEYPAHLHIDIMPGYAGKGSGRMLIEALLDKMRADGVKGIAFGVAPTNANAIGFYTHMGFTRLEEEGEPGYTFAMRLN